MAETTRQRFGTSERVTFDVAKTEEQATAAVTGWFGHLPDFEVSRAIRSTSAWLVNYSYTYDATPRSEADEWAAPAWSEPSGAAILPGAGAGG